jgi:hypothetical protein
MTAINIFVIFDGTRRLWLTLEVEKEKAREMGSGYAALTMASDPRITDAWWDFA